MLPGIVVCVDVHLARLGRVVDDTREALSRDIRSRGKERHRVSSLPILCRYLWRYGSAQ